MIRCTRCEENGFISGELCGECDGHGMIEIRECPRACIGGEITRAINVASLCGNGVLPVSGGLLDQSAWFVSLMQTLQNEQITIENERSERSANV